MMGVFGGYTRWAVVFLIIFVLFFLLCPNYVAPAPVVTKTVSMTEYDTTVSGYEMGGYMPYGNYMASDWSESSSS